MAIVFTPEFTNVQISLHDHIIVDKSEHAKIKESLQPLNISRAVLTATSPGRKGVLFSGNREEVLTCRIALEPGEKFLLSPLCITEVELKKTPKMT